MTGFYKDEDCPASQDLVAFEDGDLAPGQMLRIMDHLESCEFCAAEAELYSMYPLDAAPVVIDEPAAIPGPLYELAEALLKKKHSDPASLKGLLIELDGALAH